MNNERTAEQILEAKLVGGQMLPYTKRMMLEAMEEYKSIKVKEHQALIKELTEALETLKHSIDFTEQECNANYVISVEDKQIIESALSKTKPLYQK